MFIYNIFGCSSKISCVTIDEDDDDDFLEPIDTDHLRKIDVSEIKEGDYICIDGESSFCHTSYVKIVNVEPQVTWEAAKPEDKKLVNIVNYFLLCDEDWDTWSTLDGSCVNNPNSMYGVVGYYRYDETYSRMAEIEKLPDENSYLPIDIGDYVAKHLFEIMGQ